MAGSGWCTHPKRQEAGAVRLLVRRGELACRNSWGGDLFSGKDGDDVFRDDTAINQLDETARFRPPPIDDEVTSVVTPPARTSPVGSDDGDEDRVVSDRPSPQRDSLRDEDDGPNDAARTDQEERARLIARGNSDALAQARERLTSRHRRYQSTETVDQSPGEGVEDEVVISRTTSNLAKRASFTPSKQPRYFHRAAKRDILRAESTSDDLPVPRSEVLQTRGDAPGPERFDSVPEVDPDFDLPGWRKHRDTPGEQPSPKARRVVPAAIHGDPESDTSDSAQPQFSSYQHTLHRARRVRSSRKTYRPHPVRHDDAQSSVIEPDTPSDPESMNVRFTPGSDPVPSVLANEGEVSEVNSHQHEAEGSRGRDRRGGWLQQLGIRRWTGRSVDRPTPLADEPSAEESRQLPNVAAQSEAAAGRIDTFADDNSYETPDLKAPTEVEIPAEYDPMDTSSDITYVSNNGPLDEPGRDPAISREPTYRTTQYVLPDLDDLFADRDASQSRGVAPDLGVRDRGEATVEYSRSSEPVPTSEVLYGRTHNAPDQHLPGTSNQRQDEQDAVVSSRWSRDAALSPRDSYFRAGRFRDWDRTQHHVEDEVSWQELESDESSARVHVGTFDSRTLPDLDANTFDIREVVERGGELLDMAIEIAPDVPRACRTCRSFQSADGGVRGWCTNDWAFTHRRMVNEDDLACESSIGCWWLPADRYWKLENPLSWPSPSPLMDSFMARGTRAPNRRISGE